MIKKVMIDATKIVSNAAPIRFRTYLPISGPAFLKLVLDYSTFYKIPYYNRTYFILKAFRMGHM
jgi:hypothetical protein